MIVRAVHLALDVQSASWDNCQLASAIRIAILNSLSWAGIRAVNYRATILHIDSQVLASLSLMNSTRIMHRLLISLRAPRSFLKDILELVK